MPNSIRAARDFHSTTRLSARASWDVPLIPPSSDAVLESGLRPRRRAVDAVFEEAPRDDSRDARGPAAVDAPATEDADAAQEPIFPLATLGLAFIGGTLGGATGGGAMALGQNIALSSVTPAWIKVLAIIGVMGMAVALFSRVLRAVHGALAARPSIRLEPHPPPLSSPTQRNPLARKPPVPR